MQSPTLRMLPTVATFVSNTINNYYTVMMFVGYLEEKLFFYTQIVTLNALN